MSASVGASKAVRVGWGCTNPLRSLTVGISNLGVSTPVAKREQNGPTPQVCFPRDPERKVFMIHERKSRLDLGGAAVRDTILLILILALFGNSVLEAKVGISATVASLPQKATKEATVQECILEIPPGTMIEVRLMNKHRVRGRLGEVTNEGFSLQTAQGNKIETQKIAFTDVKSLKKAEGETTGTRISRGVVYGLAGIGVLMVILIIWAASRSD